MKALLLNLDYVGRGFVGVLQSSRYVRAGSRRRGRPRPRMRGCLRAAGFEVIREKVEALASCDGVPRDAEARRSPGDRYFEFHVLVDGRGGRSMTRRGVAARGRGGVLAAARDAGAAVLQRAQAGAAVFKPAGAGGRAGRGDGAGARARPEIAAMDGLVVKKVIAEYICFDSNRAVDNGWLEPTQG
jgi:hypothetical protein